MTKPAVSVCVPAYNGATFLAQTLQSISAQTIADFEILVVDDHSKDQTVAIAEEHAAIDPRIRIVRYEDNSGSSARNANRCLDHARGDWIKFVFQDDLLAPTCLARMLDATRDGSRFVVCWHDYLFAPEVDSGVRNYYETLPSLRTQFRDTRVSAEEFCDGIIEHWLTNFVGPTSTSLVHKDCFTRYGPFSPEIVTLPDLECWIRIGSREGLAIVPEPLTTFRVHGNSISARIRGNDRRQYRSELEGVLLSLWLASATEYSAVRARALTGVASRSPASLLVKAARGARWLATDSRYRKGDASLLEEWDAFCRAHPEILDVLREADAPQRGRLSRMRRYLASRLRVG